jgi:hypothetical protein
MTSFFHAAAACRICPLGEQLQLTIAGLTGCCFAGVGLQTLKLADSDINGTFVLDFQGYSFGSGLCGIRLYSLTASLPLYDCETDELIGEFNYALQIEWQQSKGTKGRVISFSASTFFLALDYAVGWDAGQTIPNSNEACGSPSVGPFGYGGTAVVELVPP